VGLLSVSRASVYRRPRGESVENLALMRRIDEIFLEYPFFGSRQISRYLLREGIKAGRHRVRRLMALMGLRAIYRRPRTPAFAGAGFDPHPGHKIYPYLLGGLAIARANQVWCTDITYIPMRRGFLYLVTIMDWYSRKVLAWRLSNTMDTAFCLEALEDALERYGCPEIFNSDQGSQFTSLEFTQALKDQSIKISMDGRGRWRDNIFIERFWRSLKYECVYLHAFETGSRARHEIGQWIGFYNGQRPHSKHGTKTPDEIYRASIALQKGGKTVEENYAMAA
jgi:putative transposase